MFGFRFGGPIRNVPVTLDDPRPVPRWPDEVHTGNAGRDGFTVLAQAVPPGRRPMVGGRLRYQGPDNDYD